MLYPCAAKPSRPKPPRTCVMNQSSRHDKSGMWPSAFFANNCARHVTCSDFHPLGSDLTTKNAASATEIMTKPATPARRLSRCFKSSSSAYLPCIEVLECRDRHCGVTQTPYRRSDNIENTESAFATRTTKPKNRR